MQAQHQPRGQASQSDQLFHCALYTASGLAGTPSGRPPPATHSIQALWLFRPSARVFDRARAKGRKFSVWAGATWPSGRPSQSYQVSHGPE